VKYNLKSAKRLKKRSSDGMPIYVVESDNIVKVVSAPLKLLKNPRKPRNPRKLGEKSVLNLKGRA
jgi:hypothetical protein